MTGPQGSGTQLDRAEFARRGDRHSLGLPRWTPRLPAVRIVELEIVPDVSDEAIRRLQKESAGLSTSS